MMKLKIGKMTSKELAAWFGISYGTYRNNKDEKLEELCDYADFEEVYGGVCIKEIKEETYNKGSRKSKDIVFRAFDEEWNENGLDTCSNVAVKIYDKHKDELAIAPSTTYTYTIEARNELYGKPFSAAGLIGCCRYLWAKVVYLEGEENKLFLPFTPEEQIIKDKLIKKYFGTDIEKEIMVAEMVNSGELSKEEAYDTLVEIRHLNGSGFMAFKTELEEKLNCEILKVTYLEKNTQVDKINE